MLSKNKKILWIITIVSVIILGECLSTKAIPNSIIKEEPTPDLFHIGTTYININISKTAFAPDEFTVKQSATVNLTVTSVDVGHTFEMAEYEISKIIVANSSINFEFDADKLGSFTFTSVNCSTTGTMIVEDPYVPGLPKPEDIKILFSYKHNSNSTGIQNKYSAIFNWTRDNGFAVAQNFFDELSTTKIAQYHILIILEPNNNFTSYEINDIVTFVRNGGSFIIGGSAATAFTNTYKITQQLGFTFSNTTARYINSTNPDPIGENNTLSAFTITEFLDHPIIFENQYVPLTDSLVSTLKYTGTLLNYNVTWSADYIGEDNITDSADFIDSYVFARGNETIFGDANGDFTVGENETIGINNSLIILTETASNARIFAFGAAEIFNNTMVGRYLENNIFFQRTLQWVAKMYAIIQNKEYSVSSYTLKKGDPLNTTAIFLSQNNTILESINVTARVWRNEKIEYELALTATNSSHFTGEINTSNIRIGTVSISLVAHKRGFGYNITSAYYIEIFPTEPPPQKIHFIYIITFIITILIGLIALFSFFIRVLKAPEIESTSNEAIVVGEEEDIEEIDIDEYESDESIEITEEEE